MSRPASQIWPWSGSSSRSSRRMKVVLPEPEAPTRKTNSPLSISSETSRRATVVALVGLGDVVEADHGESGSDRHEATRTAMEQPSDPNGRPVPVWCTDFGLLVRRLLRGISPLAAQLGLHEGVEVAVEHGLDVARLLARAQVLHQLVGGQDVGADLVPPGVVAPLAAHGASISARRSARAARPAWPRGSAWPWPCSGAGCARSGTDHDAGRQVGQAHRRVGLVDVLAAGARRAVGVDAQVLLVDLDLVGDVFEERHHSSEAKLVWRRCWESNGYMRTSRCTPRSVASSP